MGKTYAIWLGALLEWLQENQGMPCQPVKRRDSPALRVLWITPLRALAADTESSLRLPLDDLQLSWSLETRIGIL